MPGPDDRHGRPTYRVPRSIAAGIAAQLRNPGAAPPGANVPAATGDRPRPVVLVHGGLVNHTLNWQSMAPTLANHGHRVFSVNYGRRDRRIPSGWSPGALRPIEHNAAEIGRFIEDVLRETGAEQVDVVAESFGTLSTNHYAKYLGGAPNIGAFVAISALWDGTTMLGAHRLPRMLESLGAIERVRHWLRQYQLEVFEEVLHGSDYLTQLRADGIFAPGIRYTNITSRYEVFLTPYRTGLADGDGVTNIVLQDGNTFDLTEHLSIAASRRTAAYVLRALDPAAAVPIPRGFTTPFADFRSAA